MVGICCRKTPKEHPRITNLNDYLPFLFHHWFLIKVFFTNWKCVHILQDCVLLSFNQWLECDSFVFAVYYFPWIHVRIFAVYGILVFCIWFFAMRFSGCYEIWLSHRQNNIFLINDWSSIPCIIFHKYADFSCMHTFAILLLDINSSDQEEW